MKTEKKGVYRKFAWEGIINESEARHSGTQW